MCAIEPIHDNICMFVARFACYFDNADFVKIDLHQYIFWGRPVLTGCVVAYASMQAHGMRALITSPTSYLASLTTPWLLNLTE